MLVWMDLEMTGLDPERHVIVEIATLVTDDELNILAEGPDLVVAASGEQLEAMDDVVRRMHTTSGLLAAIEQSTTSIEDAGRATLDFVRSHVPEPGSVPLCGNSIPVDRRFLRQYLPELEDFFHYRNVDVSTLKELCKRWRPDIYAARPHKQTAHRALDDIRESVAELAYYKANFLAAPSGGTGASAPAPAGAGAAGTAGVAATSHEEAADEGS